MAGARSLWRATGLTDADLDNKPIIAIVNSFTQLVPGHVHLREVAKIISAEIHRLGAVAREFNTIAIDDGIAMGHSGMLYSLPSREIIADSIEYMVNAHCIDAMLCLSNCDKITPGMLMAALRLNIPTIFVSGGPMEAGRLQGQAVDLVDVIIASGDQHISNTTVEQFERLACPTCGSCSGLFTANSMNCLLEALGLALPGNGSLLATHSDRNMLFLRSAHLLVSITQQYYQHDDTSVLPRSIASHLAFENAMTLDIAMGGSTNTVLHLLAAAVEAGVTFTINDVDRLSRKVPNLVKVTPATSIFHMEDVHRSGGVIAILGELGRSGVLNLKTRTLYTATLETAIAAWDIRKTTATHKFYRAAPGNLRTVFSGSQATRYTFLDLDRETGCIRNISYTYSLDGGLAVLYGNIANEGCLVKTAGVAESMLIFSGPAVVCESQEEAVEYILSGLVKQGDIIVIRYEGPKGGPGMQEMLYPTSYLKAMGLNEACALITDGRFSGATSGLSIGHISPEASDGGIIALVQPGDIICINIPERTLSLVVSDLELEHRRCSRPYGSWEPIKRNRYISTSLQAYASMTSSSSYGAVRIRQLNI